jgi:hypothetical protein
MLQLLSLDELDAQSTRYDEAVGRSPALDRFCSSSVWVLPAARHLMPSATPRIYEREGSFVALARTSGWLHPLEATWCLPCPLVGADPDAAVELLLRALELEDGVDGALVTGLFPGSSLWKSLLPALGRRFNVSAGPATRRYVADLGDGIGGFLKRRSPGFRRSLEKAERRARRAAVGFETANDDASFERILAVERRSWKGRRAAGIDGEPMCSFYRDMHGRLAKSGRSRLTFARIDGEDVAYIFGGVFGDTYRGLQFSFDDRFAALSLGNLCQLEEIRRLSEEGIRRYDLGTEVSYKKRWGEEVVTTLSLVVRR